MSKTYLGDSVYATVVRGDLVLTTEYGCGPTNQIILESEVIDALFKFLAKAYQLKITAEKIDALNAIEKLEDCK